MKHYFLKSARQRGFSLRFDTNDHEGFWMKVYTNNLTNVLNHIVATTILKKSGGYIYSNYDILSYLMYKEEDTVAVIDLDDTLGSSPFCILIDKDLNCKLKVKKEKDYVEL